MVRKLAQPEDIAKEAQQHYPTQFHKVSHSTFMDDYYIKSAVMSGIREFVKTAKGEVQVLDIAAGRGRQGDIIIALLKDDAKKVRIHETDISKAEMGHEAHRDRIVMDKRHLYYADKSMDFVFMNNVPIPLSNMRAKLIEMKDDGNKQRILEMLEVAIDAEYKLNLLEAARVLKDDGVMMYGAKYAGQTKESLQKGLGDLPLEIKKFEIVELSGNVIPLWRKYGIDIEKPDFGIMSIKKTGGDLQGAVDFHEQLLYTSLEQIMRVDGFEETMKQLRKSRKA